MRIPPKAPIVYVSFSAEINPNTTESLIALMTTCATMEVSKVYLLLSTPGGSVMNGLNTYNILLGMPFELITHNIGNVDSIGNAIFLSGSKRYATSTATFMFHGVGIDYDKNVKFRLEEKNLKEHLNNILSDQKRIGDIICGRTNISIRESNRLFRNAQTKDVRYAIDKGIIDEVRDVQIPAGVPIVSFIFRR